jgi:hypothetical protein
MAAFTVDVRRFFHGFALRAAILTALGYGARTVGMGALLVICHWWLLSLGARLFLERISVLNFSNPFVARIAARNPSKAFIGIPTGYIFRAGQESGPPNSQRFFAHRVLRAIR